MAKVNNIKHSKDKYSISFNFDVNNGDLSLVNSIRRIILSEVETYAFDDIKITKNTNLPKNTGWKIYHWLYFLIVNVI